MDRSDANAAVYMPESSVGKVLQRGGQELLLDKVEDRFAVQTSDQQLLTQFINQIPAADVVVQAQAVPLTEIQVRPEVRDQVMHQVRSTEGVDYASHVYRVQSAPSSLIYLTNQITIQFDPTASLSEVSQIATEMGLQQVKSVAAIANTFVFELTAAATENPLKIANRLMQRSQVWAAEPNVITRTQSLYRPRDPFYPKQWYLNHGGGTDLATHSHISVEKAWDITRGDRSVVVAIMDDSIDLSHPDFQGMGLGRQLVERLKEKLTPDRRHEISLVIRETNVGAQLCFKALGFRAVKIKDNFYQGLDEQAYVMSFKLPANS